MDTLLNLYGLFVKDKGKERFEIILEPMQAMTQLALMSFCPKGSKMSISNNLLTIQTPTWMQGIMRTYNHDKRDDLFFLFNVIIRFNKFYGYMKTQNNNNNSNNDDKKLFELIVKLSKKGLDNILQTYAYSDQPSLLHTLQMYRTMLDKPEIFAVDNPFSAKEKGNYVKENRNNNKNNKERENNKEKEKERIDNEVVDKERENKEDLSDSNSSNNNANANANSVKDIDDVFIKIRQIYNKSEFNIIYHNLLMLEKNPEHYETYMQGINASMHPVNLQIKKWINDNIVY